MIKKTFMQSISKTCNFLLVILFVILTYYSKAQENVNIDLLVGNQVFNTANPLDSIYDATVTIRINDSVMFSVNSIRVVVTDSGSVLTDKRFNVENISETANTESWKNNGVFYVKVANYNPLYRRKYVIELINVNGQLILQYEKEI
jgi:hypothetical protein